MGDSPKLVACLGPWERHGTKPITVDNREEEEMEAYHIDRFGSVDGIVLRSSEDPRPGPKGVLMRVRASSLNYRDLMVLKGGGRGPTKLGVVPLSDGAGEVAAIGDGVTRVRIGDRIAGRVRVASRSSPCNSPKSWAPE
jgi:NADPH:quinone reductase-like Zn-dependent oxidoreductase